MNKGTQKLYLDTLEAEMMKGKRVLIVDDVISTGESLKALEILVEKAQVLRQGLNEGWEGITEDMVLNAENNAQLALEKYPEVGKNIGEGTKNGIETSTPEVETSFDNVINSTITKGNTTAGTSTTVGDNLITATQAGILAGTGNLNTTVENTITGAKKKGETGAREFTSVGSNISGNTAQGVSDNGSGIGTNLASAVALAQILDLSGFSAVGNGIINGIKAGIDAVSATLIAKMKGIASSALSAAKGALGIHSPSRVFRDIVGKNIIRGIGVGLEKEYPSLEKDLTNMMENLTDLDMNDIMTTLHCSVDTNVAKSAIQNMVGYNAQAQNTINLTSSLDGNIEIVLQADGRVLARTVAPYQKEFTNYSVGRK